MKKIICFCVINLAITGLVRSQDEPVEEAAEPTMSSERIRLSYVDPARCTQLLQLYGVTIGKPTEAVDPKKLPVVVPLPTTKFHETIPDHEKVFPKRRLIQLTSCACSMTRPCLRKREESGE